MRSFICLLLLAAAGVPAAASRQTHSATPRVVNGSDGHRSRSYLGISLADLDDDQTATLKLDGDRGVEVTRVQPGSPAEKAGIKVGDVLLSYNGENILSVLQLVRLVGETPSGRRLRMQLWRGEQIESVSLVTAEPPPGSNTSGFPFPGWDARTINAIAVANVPTPAVFWRNFPLGINCEVIESQLAAYFGVKHGLLVRYVEKNSVAERAGVLAGDVITAVADKVIETPQDLGYDLGGDFRSVRNVPLSIVRDHKRLTVNLKLSE